MTVAAMNPPFSTAVVDVPGEDVEKYKAQGWREVKRAAAPSEAEKPARNSARRS